MITNSKNLYTKLAVELEKSAATLFVTRKRAYIVSAVGRADSVDSLVSGVP